MKLIFILVLCFLSTKYVAWVESPARFETKSQGKVVEKLYEITKSAQPKVESYVKAASKKPQIVYEIPPDWEILAKQKKIARWALPY